MDKIIVQLNNKDEVRLTYDYLFAGFESAVDMLERDDSFDIRNTICNLYRILNQLMIAGNFGDDFFNIPILFYEDFTIDTSFMDDDTLIFDGSEIGEFDVRVRDISQYEIVDDDVIVLGRNYLDDMCPCLIIICEDDWKKIQDTIREVNNNEM